MLWCSISKVVLLFKQLNVDVVTHWWTAHTMALELEEWNEDPKLRKLPTLDILLAFEDYSCEGVRVWGANVAISNWENEEGAQGTQIFQGVS